MNLSPNITKFKKSAENSNSRVIFINSSLSQCVPGARVEWVTIYGNLLKPPWSKNYYVIESRNDKDVTDRKNWLFVAQHLMIKNEIFDENRFSGNFQG